MLLVVETEDVQARYGRSRSPRHCRALATAPEPRVSASSTVSYRQSDGDTGNEKNLSNTRTSVVVDEGKDQRGDDGLCRFASSAG